MPLDYFLTENRLTDRPDDMTAITQSGASIDENGLIDRILAKGTVLDSVDPKSKIDNTFFDLLVYTKKVFFCLLYIFLFLRH